jgi:excisionase family DNA binding protein
MRIDKAGIVERIYQRMDGRIQQSEVEKVLDLALEETITALKDGGSVGLSTAGGGVGGHTPSVGDSGDLSKIERHMKTEPLAERLGISADTPRRAAQRGDLRPIRIGRNLFWPESEVQRWLDAQRQPERVTTPR